MPTATDCQCFHYRQFKMVAPKDAVAPPCPGRLWTLHNSMVLVCWYGTCTVSCRKTLQCIVRAAERIIGASKPSGLQVTPPTHLTASQSGKRLQRLWVKTRKLIDSFIHQGVRKLLAGHYLIWIGRPLYLLILITKCPWLYICLFYISLSLT